MQGFRRNCLSISYIFFKKGIDIQISIVYYCISALII